VARDQAVRRRIIEYLSNHGPIVDGSGRATAILKEAVEHQGSDAAFAQVVSAMAKAGVLVREVRGKRTYRISHDASKGEDAGAIPAAVQGPMDYDELAAALLAQVARTLSAPTEPSDSASWARRRLEQLEARNTTLQREVARANAEAEAIAAERDVLQSQLDAAQHNLSLLTERLKEPKKPLGRAADRLGSDEQTLLYRLRAQQGPRSPERAG